MADDAVMETPSMGKTFEQFADFLREPEVAGPLLSPKRFCQALHIDLQTLAEQAHVHRNTASRSPGSPVVQDFLRQALRVIKAATYISGDLHKALFWYRNEPLSVFDYKTAERLVCDGRTDALVKYVVSLEAGAAG
jgi:hypothetical protein